MNRLRLQVSRDGQKVLNRDIDDCTVVIRDTETDTDVVSIWGDGANGLWLYEPGEEEPFQIVPIRED